MQVSSEAEETIVSEEMIASGDDLLTSGLRGVVVPTSQNQRIPSPLVSLRGGAGALLQGQRQKAAELFKRFGVAYILCSLSLSACSFAVFYALVRSGVNVAGLMRSIGFLHGSVADRLGTVGLAYLLHKAASPIRFPPTVVLTMAVGRLLESDKSGDGTAAKAPRPGHV